MKGKSRLKRRENRSIRFRKRINKKKERRKKNRDSDLDDGSSCLNPRRGAKGGEKAEENFAKGKERNCRWCGRGIETEAIS